MLCSHFLTRYCEEHRRANRRLSPQALDLLCNRVWPGNVRELENVIEQAVLFSRGEVIKPSDLAVHRDEARREEPGSLDDIVREHIRTVLARTAGNKLKVITLAPPNPGEVKVTLKIDPLQGETTVVNNEISTYVTVTKEGVSVLFVDKLRFPEPQPRLVV